MSTSSNVSQVAKHSISLVIPVYNEELNIAPLAEKILASIAEIQPAFWEAILVNDGSVDRTESLLDELVRKHPGFRAIHFTANNGQTAAMDAGIRAAKGEFIVTLDGDLQNDPADIKMLLEQMAPGIGCVAGFRKVRQDNFVRRISSKIANAIRNRISQETIRDTGCSLKVFRRAAFDNIKLFEGMHRFLPTLVKMEGYSVVEVAVSHHPRHAGESKYGVWNRLFKSLKDLFAVRWMKQRRLHYQVKASSGGSQ